MNQKNDLTSGSITKTLIMFALPYLLACFMQTFYGMADLFVIGLYNGSEVTSAVSIGSQFMHMMTVIIVGLCMGVTVKIGHAIGEKNDSAVSENFGTAIVMFSIFAAVITVVLLFLTRDITIVMMTPKKAVSETISYLKICFLGIPFIVGVNVISSALRGMGDSKSPMWFVGVACVINVLLDFLFVGYFGMAAAGAAIATVMGQAMSMFAGVGYLIVKRNKVYLSKKHLKLKKNRAKDIVAVGSPIALQDGLIQIAFIVITIIANSRGLVASSAVGIVEKLICFIFLVPSAFLSAISAVTAQNVGAGRMDRAKKALFVGMSISVAYGALCFMYSLFLPETLVGLFTRDNDVLIAGCEYLKSYSVDTAFASIHFCFSGFFCGDQKSILSFIHNMISVCLLRVPGAYLASKLFPQTLLPMGLAAPIGSLFSAAMCFGFYIWYYKRKKI